MNFQRHNFSYPSAAAVVFGGHLCCFDEGKLIVLFNGFQKKTQKTPLNEIEKAMRIKKEYFESKK